MPVDTDQEMTTSQLLDYMAPDPKSAFDDERLAREASHWCVCFLALDMRGREVGLNGILPPGLPFLFRTRSYQHRSDSLDENASFFAVSTQYARDAVNSVNMMYSEHGFTIMHRLTGKDSEADKREIAKTIARYIPNWRTFDKAEDPDWNLFQRRGEHLREARSEEPEGSIPAIVLEYLIDANAQAGAFCRRIAASVLSEAEAGRAGRIGRTKPDEFELACLKWCGLQPSKHFDGYDTKEKAAVAEGQAQMAEALNLMREAFLRQEDDSKDTDIEAMKTMVREMSKQIAELKAAQPKPDKPGKG